MPPSPSTRRRADDRARRRARIIAAATRLFARRGLENVTFGDIAQKAGLSRPLVYFYFPDQRALFLEAVLAVRSGLLERLEAATASVRDRGGSGLEELDALCRAYAAFQEDEPDAFQLTSLCDAQSAPIMAQDALGQLISGSERSLYQCLVKALERGMADGSLDVQLGQAGEVAAVIWGWMQGLIQLRAARPRSLKANAQLEPGAYLEVGLKLLRRALVSGSGPGIIPALDCRAASPLRVG